LAEAGGFHGDRVVARGQLLSAVAALAIAGGRAFHAFGNIAYDDFGVGHEITLRILHGYVEIARGGSALPEGIGAQQHDKHGSGERGGESFQTVKPHMSVLHFSDRCAAAHSVFLDSAHSHVAPETTPKSVGQTT